MSEPETIDALTSRHKKELKALEGEKRAALKNAKAMGKKAKAKIKEVEFKYEGLERDIKARHAEEVEALHHGGANDDDAAITNVDVEGATATDAADTKVTFDAATETKQTELQAQQTQAEEAEAKRLKAQQKKLKKKQAAKQKEIDREARIAQENASAGPSRRLLEIDAMTTLHLTPNKLKIQDVTADGNCLYRAIGQQAVRLGLLTEEEAGYDKIRQMCADILLSEREEYEPFAELDHDVNHPAGSYEEYVEHVRDTNTWGGQLELRALSHGLKVPVVVFSAEGPPLTMGREFESGGEEEAGYDTKRAILVSFHRYYYALGEHYNSVVPLEEGS